MRKLVSRVAGAAFVIVACAVPQTARAEPILITVGSGFADFRFGLGGSVNIAGDRGFTLVGTLNDPGVSDGCCFVPGVTSSFSGLWSGLDFTGTATVDGTAYSVASALGGTFSTGPLTMPTPAVGNATARAPFVATGLFALDTPGMGDPLLLTLAGSGTGSVFLTATADSLWTADAARLDFGTTGAPIPEPTTLLLMGIGLAGAYRATRSHQS